MRARNVEGKKYYIIIILVGTSQFLKHFIWIIFFLSRLVSHPFLGMHKQNER